MAFNFATNSDTIVTNDPPNLTSGDITTFACRFKPDDTTADYTLIAYTTDATNSNGYFIQALGATGGAKIRFRANVKGDTTSYYVDTTNTYTAGDWCTVVGVANRNAQRLYISLNGHPYLTSSMTVTTPAGNPDILRIGYLFGSLRGDMAEVAIWKDNALPIFFSNQLHQGLVPLRFQPETITAYWPLIANGQPAWRGDYPLTITGATKSDHCRRIP